MTRKLSEANLQKLASARSFLIQNITSIGTAPKGSMIAVRAKLLDTMTFIEEAMVAGGQPINPIEF